MEQFLRTELLFGKEKINKIFNANVTVIGLGAVGISVRKFLPE
jgi:tRNA A37 threonylcarbamoyladenosine dehydratase